jgi:PEGA domain-containing protein
MRQLLVVILLLATTTGCAAILGTKQKNFDLNSNPSGADVYLNGNRLGSTPLKVKLSNQATHTFVFRRQGYQEATCTLNRGTGAGWVILDVLTGLVPIVIDAATGSWSQTKGNGCLQSLEPGAAAAAPRAPAPTQAAPTAPARATPTTAPPVAAGLVDDVPPGTNWVADSRNHTYYKVGCPATAKIAPTDRLYYGNESALRAAGFARAQEC